MPQRKPLLLLAAGILAAAQAWSQSDRGVLTGTVTDPGGAVIPKARVTATHLSTGVTQSIVSGESGDFTLPSAPVGEYRIVVEMEGFKSAVHDKVLVTAGSATRLDTALEVGSVQQTVEVVAHGAQLSMDDSKVISSVTNRMIDELPTVVSEDIRNPFDLASMAAGVRNEGDQEFRIAGGQAGSFGVYLDGTSAGTNRAGAVSWASVNAPSLDAITEFTVETNGFKAEYGRAGGGMITFVSRGGTNRFNGTLFDFVRNDFFDSRGFFNRSVPAYKQHDFGGTAGGRVVIPKLYDGRNKTFFFVSYEGFRNRVGGRTDTTAVPPLEFYKGDFSNLVGRNRRADGTYAPITVYDPGTTVPIPDSTNFDRLPFPGNQIPLSRFDPISRRIAAIASESRKPNRTGVVPGTPEYLYENYWQGGTSLRPINKYSVKIDHVLTAAHRLNFYFGYTRRFTAPGPTGPPGIPDIFNAFQYDKQTSPVYRASWDYTISPRLFNRFFIGINRFVDGGNSIAWGKGWKEKGICIPNVPNCDVNLPILAITDYGTWAGPGYNGSENPVYSLNEQIMFNTGKHAIKAGYQWELGPYNGIGNQQVAGRAAFNRNMTALPGDRRQGDAVQSGGSPFASFLLGEAAVGNLTTPRFVAMRWRYRAMFLQDDWRVSRRFTLMLGLRFEYNLPPLNDNDECSDFDPTVPNPGANGRPGALVFCGFGEGRVGRRSIPPGWYGGWGPRLGLAYRLDNRTVLRMSGARSFGAVRTVTGSSHFHGFAQILTFPDQFNGVQSTFRLSGGMPPWIRPPVLDPAFSNDAEAHWWQGKEASRLPEVLSWTATIQRQLATNTLLEFGYSAQVGTHLIAGLLNYNQVDINKLPPELSIFTVTGRNTLNRRYALLTAAQKAAYPVPYPGFNTDNNLERSLRPFPQYNTINTTNGGGDHSGHSSYHSLLVKLTRNYYKGLLIDASYVLSKAFTDAETTWGGAAAIDHFNRRLEKAVSMSDRTHELKINWIGELPFGRGRRFVKTGLLSRALGGWRVGSVHSYMSGTPLGLAGAFNFPIVGERPYIETYDGWRAPIEGKKFDPFVDRFVKPSSRWTTNAATGEVTVTQQGFFPVQPNYRWGNMTRNNPKLRGFPRYNENVSLAKSFPLAERRRVEFRAEGFNLLNRTVFASPNMTLGDNLGLVRNQANKARQMQFALKLYW